MICPRCLHRLTTLSTPRSPRRLSTTARLLHPASTPATHSTQTSARSPPSSTHDGPPAATSTSAAQPLSTPLPPAPSSASAETPAEGAFPRSSVPAGTILKGLNYFKGRDGPVAKDDSEYPSWLWGLLSPTKAKGAESEEADNAGDLYCTPPPSPPPTGLPCPLPFPHLLTLN